MRVLDDCLTLTREIKELEEQILELKTIMLSPKGQVITGMPKGKGPAKSLTGDYLARVERLEERKYRKVLLRESMWNDALTVFNKNKIRKEYITLMQHRFYSGLQWKQCCVLMGKEYPDQRWNMNKVFRIYRQTLRKAR